MRTFKKFLSMTAAYLLILSGWMPSVRAQQGQSVQSFVGGVRVAANYGYGFNNVNGANIVQGFTGTGTQSATVCPAVRALGDGRVINLFSTNAPVLFDMGTSISETVTPTSVSLITPPIGQQGDQQCAVLTGSFTFAHGASQFTNQVRSGTFGLQEAINDAASANTSGYSAGTGGLVAVDASWGGTSTMLAAAQVYPNVSIADYRFGGTTYWNPQQSTAAVLPAPTALTGQAACDATHSFCSDANAVGTWAAVAYFGCIAYVDIMGQEGPCSTTATFTAVASKAIDVGVPAASTGAVGYVIYIGTSYLLASSVAITPSVCTMTTLETTTPACAITNTKYGQTGSTFGVNALFTGGAQVAAITLVTSPGKLLATTASATTAYIGTPNGRSASYVYAPSSRLGIPGVPGVSLPFTITSAAASTVPNVVATINLPPAFMNFIGRTIRVCGFASATGTSSATIVGFTLWWEAAPSNASGPLPLIIGGPNVTGTLASAIDQYSFCQEFSTITTGATGTVLPGNGTLTFSDTVAGTHPFSGPNVQVGAPAAMSLTGGVGFPTHLHVVYLHTTGTDGTGIIAQKITVEAL